VPPKLKVDPVNEKGDGVEAADCEASLGVVGGAPNVKLPNDGPPNNNGVAGGS